MICLAFNVGIESANLEVLTVLCGNANVSKCQATLFHVVTGWPVNLTHTDFSCPEVCMGFFMRI